MKYVNLEPVIHTLSWYKTGQLSYFNLIRAKQKTSQETENGMPIFLEPIRKPKSHLHCEDFSWNQCKSTPQR